MTRAKPASRPSPPEAPPPPIERAGRGTLQSRLFWAAFAAIVLVGVFLRVWQIGGQFVLDDEMHAIRALSRHPASYILTHFFNSDICIPQTIFLKIVSGLSPLTETSARLLSLAFGIALLFWPLLLRRQASAGALLILAAMTALHPLLVLYSRYERQYIVVVALATASLLCFHRLCETGRRRLIVLHALLAAMAMYFHLLAAPTVCAPLALAIASNLLGGFPLGRKFRLPDIALGALVLGVTLAATLGPPVAVDHQSLTSKSMKAALAAPTFYVSALMFLGVKNAWLGAPALLVLVLGVARLFRENRPLASIIAIPFVLQLAAMIILRPSMLDVPDVFVRYTFWELPLLLYCFVAGLGAIGQAAGRMLPAAAGVELTIAAVWLALSPTWAFAYRHNNFMFPYMYQRMVVGRERYIPKIYPALASLPEPGAVAEAPWIYFKDVTPWPDYQAVHRRDVYAILLSDMYRSHPRLNQNEDGVRGERLRFGKFITIDDAGRNPEIRFLVFHLKPAEEYGPADCIPVMNMSVIRSRIDPMIWRRAYADDDIEAYIKRR